MAIKKTTLHPQGDQNTDLYPKTSVDQVEGIYAGYVGDIISNNSFIKVSRTAYPTGNDYYITFDFEFAVNMFSVVFTDRINSAQGTDSIVLRYTGTVDSTHYPSSCTGESCAILGEANSCGANRVISGGKLNVIQSPAANALVGGLSNNVIGAHTLTIGNNNDNRQTGSIVGGAGNTASSPQCLVVGNNNYSAKAGCIVGGQYNDYSRSNALLILGNGNSGFRSNAFEVLDDGTLIIGGVAITPNQLRQLLALIGG